MTQVSKIQIIYPDGRRDCRKNVTETYRNAIEYIGLEKVRSLGFMRNSINIVSTREEMEGSVGGHKETCSISRLANPSDLGICTEFSTKDKFRYLVQINEALHSGLHISLTGAEDADTTVFIPAEEVSNEIREGLTKEYNATRYERSPVARRLCLDRYKGHVVCQVCGFDFEKTYGKRDNAEPYIEIHHINPLAEVSVEAGEHKVDYARDLIPVCANCHRMLHFLRKETLHPSDLKRILDDRNSDAKYSTIH